MSTGFSSRVSARVLSGMGLMLLNQVTFPAYLQQLGTAELTVGPLSSTKMGL